MASIIQRIMQLWSGALNKSAKQSSVFDRRLFSLGLFQAFLFLIFHTSSAIRFEESAYLLVYPLTCLFASTVLICGVFVRYKRRSRVILLVFAAILGALGTLGIHYFSIGVPALVLWSMLLGISIGILIPFVGKIFSSADLDIAMRQTFLSFAFAAVLYFLVLGIPEILRIILIAILPLVLAVVILLPTSTSTPKRHHVETTTQDEVGAIIRSRPVVFFFIGVGLLGFAFGFSMAFCSLHGFQTFDTANGWSVLITGVGALLYLLIIRATKSAFDFENCFSPILPIIAIGLMLIPYEPFVSTILIILGFQLADMVVWVVFSWIANHSGQSQRVFCIGKSSMYVGMSLGAIVIIASSFTPEVDALPLVVVSVGIYLVLSTIVFIFNNSNVTAAIKSSFSDSDFDYFEKAIKLRCDEFGKEYGLTIREKEMLVYLVQGRSLPYIESVMFVSHGTANSHRDHIYAKTKVHSKQQLLDLFFGIPKEAIGKSKKPKQ